MVYVTANIVSEIYVLRQKKKLWTKKMKKHPIALKRRRDIYTYFAVIYSDMHACHCILILFLLVGILLYLKSN